MRSSFTLNENSPMESQKRKTTGTIFQNANVFSVKHDKSSKSILLGLQTSTFNAKLSMTQTQRSDKSGISMQYPVYGLRDRTYSMRNQSMASSFIPKTSYQRPSRLQILRPQYQTSSHLSDNSDILEPTLNQATELVLEKGILGQGNNDRKIVKEAIASLGGDGYDQPVKRSAIDKFTGDETLEIEHSGSDEESEQQSSNKSVIGYATNYLERQIERRNKLTYKKYSHEMVRTFPQIKSVLSHRYQFNEKKQIFFSQCLEKYGSEDLHQLLYGLDYQKRLNQEKNQLSDIDEDEDTKGCLKAKIEQFKISLAEIKNQNEYSVHGHRIFFNKNSLGIFSNKNPIRVMMVWFITWPWFDRFILLLIILNSISLGIRDYGLLEDEVSIINEFIEKIDVYFTVAFIIECVCKVIAQGFLIGKNTYLKDVWNWIDFSVVVASLLEAYLGNISALRTFRLFRPLKSLNAIPSMKTLMNTLFQSFAALGSILGLMSFFFMIYAILGISLLKGLSHYRCYETEFPQNGDWVLVDGDTNLCSEDYNPCKIGFCRSLLDYEPQEDLYNILDKNRDTFFEPSLNYGFTNFDDIFYAFLTIFQCITTEGWTTVMYMYLDVANQYFVIFFYVSCIIINNFFLLNLTIAVMLTEYDDIEKQNTNSPHQSVLMQEGMNLQLPRPLINFLINQQNLKVSKEAINELKGMEKKKGFFLQLFDSKEPPDDDYYMHKTTRICYKIAMSNIFGSFIMFCIVLNTVCLAMDKDPPLSQEIQDLLDQFNLFFMVVFTGEVIIKLIGLGTKPFFKDHYNTFDLFTVLMSIVELFFSEDSSSSLGVLRVIRLFRVFKLFKSGDLRTLMDSIAFTVSTIGNYAVLLLLFLYVFSLMGMNLFAGQIKFDEVGKVDLVNGSTPRLNFDTLSWAFITVFAVMIGDNWTTVMYDAIRAKGFPYAIFFVIVFAFGNIIMLNLFLALLLGNFDKARQFGARMKIMETFKLLRERGFDLSKCIDLILQESSEYVKAGILGWPKEVIEYEKQNESSFMRSMIENKAQFMDLKLKTLPQAAQEQQDSPSKYEHNNEVSDESRYSQPISEPDQIGQKELITSFKTNQSPFVGKNPPLLKRSNQDVRLEINEKNGQRFQSEKKNYQSTLNFSNPALKKHITQLNESQTSTERVLDFKKLSTIQSKASQEFSPEKINRIESLEMKTLSSQAKSLPKGTSKQKSGASIQLKLFSIGEHNEEKSDSDINQRQSLSESNDESENSERSAFDTSNDDSFYTQKQKEDKSSTLDKVKKGQSPVARNAMIECDKPLIFQDKSDFQESYQSPDFKKSDICSPTKQIQKAHQQIFGQVDRVTNIPKVLKLVSSEVSNNTDAPVRVEFKEHNLNINEKELQNVPQRSKTLFGQRGIKKERSELNNQSTELLIKPDECPSHDQQLGSEPQQNDMPTSNQIRESKQKQKPRLIALQTNDAIEEASELSISSDIIKQKLQYDSNFKEMVKQSYEFAQDHPQVYSNEDEQLQLFGKVNTSNMNRKPDQDHQNGVHSGSQVILGASLKLSQSSKRRQNPINSRIVSHDLNQFDDEKLLTCWGKIVKYMQESSLCIFHKNWKIRKYCLRLLIDTDSLVNNQQANQSYFTRQQTRAVFDKQKTALDFQASSQNLKIKTNVNKMQPHQLQDFADNQTNEMSNDQKFKERSPNKSIMLNKSINQSMLNSPYQNSKSRNRKKAGLCGRLCSCCMSTKPHQFFENFILLLIFTSSIMLMIDNPLDDPNSLKVRVIFFIDMFHTIMFTIEALIKIIGLGFLFNKLSNQPTETKAYLRSVWNMIDFLVVVASLAELFLPLFIEGNAADFKTLKAFRSLRALRPLRMVSRNEGMKLVVRALGASLPAMTNVIIVCLLLLSIMAIMGVNFFKGTFYDCIDLPEILLRGVKTQADCLESGGRWVREQQNFDNIGYGLLTLFQMMTTEGWLSVMYRGIDKTEVGIMPIQNHNVWFSIYFITFMIIGSQFIINLFVGVVIDNFNRIKEQEELGNIFVTDEQRKWVEIQRVILQKSLLLRVNEPQGFQKFFKKITDSTIFEYIITGCIVLNTITMACDHHQSSQTFDNVIENLNDVFAYVFNLEMIFKLLALGRRYFKDPWNLFDMFIVIGTDIGLFLKVLELGEGISSATSVIRGFRIGRIFRLVKTSVNVRLLIDTILNILPQMRNIMSLMFILLFIYASLGINLFAGAKGVDQITDKNNFQSFGSAMLVLLRCVTGEDWNLIMFELANEEDCLANQTYEDRERDGILGCGSIVSYLYFLSFMILLSFIIMNLSVAAVLEGLDTARQENLGIVSGDVIDEFNVLWKDYDPSASGWITINDLIFLLVELDEPLGRKKKENGTDELRQQSKENNQQRYLTHPKKNLIIKQVDALAMLKDNLKINIFNKKTDTGESLKMVHYMDILKSLIGRVIVEKKNNKSSYEVQGKLENKINDLWQKKYKSLKQNTNERINFTADQFSSIKIIENWYMKRRYRMQKAKQIVNNAGIPNIHAKNVPISSVMKHLKRMKIQEKEKSLAERQKEASQSKIGIQSPKKNATSKAKVSKNKESNSTKINEDSARRQLINYEAENQLELGKELLGAIGVKFGNLKDHSDFKNPVLPNKGVENSSKKEEQDQQMAELLYEKYKNIHLPTPTWFINPQKLYEEAEEQAREDEEILASNIPTNLLIKIPLSYQQFESLTEDDSLSNSNASLLVINEQPDLNKSIGSNQKRKSKRKRKLSGKSSNARSVISRRSQLTAGSPSNSPKNKNQAFAKSKQRLFKKISSLKFGDKTDNLKADQLHVIKEEEGKHEIVIEKIKTKYTPQFQKTPQAHSESLISSSQGSPEENQSQNPSSYLVNTPQRKWSTPFTLQEAESSNQMPQFQMKFLGYNSKS